MEAPFMDRLARYTTGQNEIRVVLGNGYKIHLDTDIEIDRLFIEEGQRKKGRAGDAIKEIIRLGREHGFERIWVFANPDEPCGENGIATREELVRFYEKFGFDVYTRSKSGTMMKIELK